MKNKINSYIEYKKEFNDLIKNCDLKTNSKKEIKKIYLLLVKLF